MRYTYIQLQRSQSLLHSYTQAMLILEDGSSFDFIHNFPSVGLVSIESILNEWIKSTTRHTTNSLVQFVRQWRHRRKWLVLKNKHFFDCFVVPMAALQTRRIDQGAPVGEEWWLQRF